MSEVPLYSEDKKVQLVLHGGRLRVRVRVVGVGGSGLVTFANETAPVGGWNGFISHNVFINLF